jgi:hypothetical protein
MPAEIYNLKTFINSIKGKREVGLIIAQNDSELKKFENELLENNLLKAEAYRDLFVNKLFFYNINNETSREILKYIIEYPAGAIGVHSKKSNQFKWFYPTYENQVFILLITEKDLENLEGINLLDYVSSTYRAQKVNA